MRDGSITTSDFSHVPVLFHEAIEGLNIKEDGIYVDGTMGGGGHSAGIAGKLSDKGHLYCFDQDEDAIRAGSKRLDKYKDKVTIFHENYVRSVMTLRDHGVQTADGILLDLGVSSYQLDTAERGFSYSEDAPLDMRMDKRGINTAETIVNSYEEKDLVRILRDYGEERFAVNIAKGIIRAREEGPIKTTFELNDIIDKSIPKSLKQSGVIPRSAHFRR